MVDGDQIRVQMVLLALPILEKAVAAEVVRILSLIERVVVKAGPAS